MEKTGFANNYIKGLKKEPVPLILAAVHWLASFWLERLVIEVSPSANLFNYLCCKAILLVSLYWFWRFLWRVFVPVKDGAENSPAVGGSAARASGGSRASGRGRRVFLFALPYLIYLIWWLRTYHSFQLVSDELNIFLDAVRLESYAYWFNYFTGFFWIVCLMVVPMAMGPVFVKVFLQALVCGYCADREFERSRGISFLPVYLLFCLPFVMDQGISAHRLPTYGMVYMAAVCKLVYDRAEQKELALKDLLLLSAAFSVLAIWRSEGIYFVPLGLILILCAYRVYKQRKTMLRTAAIYALVLAIAAVPQIKSYFFEENPSVALRTKPFMAYAVTIMMRNGLTEDMIGDEAAEMSPFVPVETVIMANEQYGESIYNGAFVLRHAKKAEYPDQERFCSAVKRIILKYPVLYIRSQIEAFKRVDRNTVYKPDMGLYDRIRVFSWHVSVPAALTAVFVILSLAKRWWLSFWLALGSLGNLVLVVALMPATFPKYFYLTYLFAFYMCVLGMCRVLREKEM